MKIRLGFVSNSSTSSFICDICGRNETGFDVSHTELGYVQCPNGHLICEEEALEKIDEDAVDCKDELEDDDYDDYEITEDQCPICLFQVSSKSDIKEYLKKKYNVSDETVFAEVKKLNARRKKLYDSEYVNYVFKENNIQEADLLLELKNTYKTYSEFLKYLRG